MAYESIIRKCVEVQIAPYGDSRYYTTLPNPEVLHIDLNPAAASAKKVGGTPVIAEFLEVHPAFAITASTCARSAVISVSCDLMAALQVVWQELADGHPAKMPSSHTIPR